MVEPIADVQVAASKNLVEGQKPSIRQQLKEFLSRYYALRNFRPVEARNTLEIYTENNSFPQMEYVFDRKTLRENPGAELITFNSPMLKKITDQVTEKGQIAKGFIPFKHDPEQDFQKDLQKLIASGNTQFPEKTADLQFLQNGKVTLLRHHLKYAPFLVFLLKIILKTIEPQELIETVVIPVIDEKQITASNAKAYIGKVKAYLETDAPLISDKMPVSGDLIEFTDEKVKDALQHATEGILMSIEDRKKALENRLGERLRKELEIIERYYAERERELEDKIASDDEKASDTEKTAEYRKQKKEAVPKLKGEVRKVKEELEAKRNEFQAMYSVTTEFKVLAVAAIYIPADFHFTCQLSSEFGTAERDFFYDIFDQTLIPPPCDGCGKPVYFGRLCINLHICCPTCGQPCKECKKQVCRACDARICNTCGTNLCKDHAHECSRCKEKGNPSYSACFDHWSACLACGKPICDQCAASCAICGKRICKETTLCSVTCNVCHRPTCSDHTITCMICGQPACTEDIGICSSCHQKYCIPHLAHANHKCDTCVKLSFGKFNKFRKTKGNQFEIPSQVGIPLSHDKVGVRVGNRYVQVPKHLAKIKMNSNKRFLIFQIPKVLEDFVLVVDREAGRQVLYRNVKVLGKVKEFLMKKSQPVQYELSTPAVGGTRISFAATEEPEDITESPSEASSTPNMCPKCGKTAAIDFNVCPYCGTPLSRESKE